MNDRIIKVAAVQFEPRWNEVERNRSEIIRFAIQAAEQGARLIVFPEMATSGYIWESRAEIAPFTETVPGETTTILSAITAQYDCYLVIGLPEKDEETDCYYNTAVLIGPDGVIGRYRKTHLFAADPKWAREGNEDIPVFPTPIGNIAMLICMDAMYFEPARLTALKGADIVAFPTNWVGAGNKPPSKTWRLRAKENGVLWLASNRWGTEKGAQFTGGTAIISPLGEVLDQLVAGDGIVYGKWQVDRSRRETYLQKREVGAYHDLLLHPYLWKEGETRAVAVKEAFDVMTVRLTDGGAIQAHLHRHIQSNAFTSKHRLVVVSEVQAEDRSSTIAAFAEITACYELYLVVTIKTDRKTCYLFGPQGVVASYDEVHPEKPVQRVKGAFQTVELPFARVGLLTDHDGDLPESYRVLAKQGADLIALSAGGKSQAESWMYKIWAYENDSILAVSTPPGLKETVLFLHSQVEQSSGDMKTMTETFTVEKLRKAGGRPFLRRLKPHLYERLVTKITEKAGV
ncbi:nitrilase [Alkalihalobacillus oceani]|uniref:Nitrilase n=1 Tax=Halalkalibacter oceani TaxID=1653776 RepID=A0A9X2IPZ3_9BACI|nr:nitrilase-related carbon-nitrogen hydrolase [Halalkalibacter oceani]MCM3716539.1 nitrilase [Halalkalibacter oceani]